MVGREGKALLVVLTVILPTLHSSVLRQSGRKGRRTVRIRRKRTRRRRNRRKEEQGRKRTRWGPGECSIELAFWIHILLGRKRHGM